MPVADPACEFVPAAPTSTSERFYRWFEFVCLFGVMPGLFALRTVSIPFLLLLYSALGICLTILMRDKTFDRARLWRAEAVRGAIPRILALYVPAMFLLGAMVYRFMPDAFLSFPRERPVIWAAVMLLYPILSVWPQNVIYRAFIHHRYACLFRSPTALLLASAAAFCWGHIIFQNWVALALTFPGGLIFAATYQRTRSTLAASLEHALYGCLVFTVGLGQSLYLAGIYHAK
jgi:membrane protease YdiL (CAAX protease family)